MTNFPTPGRSAWLFTVLVAASSMACAVWLTHVTSGYAENIIMRTGFQGDLTPLAKPFLAADLLRKVAKHSARRRDPVRMAG